MMSKRVSKKKAAHDAEYVSRASVKLACRRALEEMAASVPHPRYVRILEKIIRTSFSRVLPGGIDTEDEKESVKA